jgi:hypothetical protein
VWKNIKHDRIGEIDITSKDELKTKATCADRKTACNRARLLSTTRTWPTSPPDSTY